MKNITNWTDICDKYFKLFEELNNKKKILTEKEYKEMYKFLSKQFNDEITILKQKNEIDHKQKMKELKSIYKMTVPRKFLFFKNKAAREMENNCKIELSNLYEQKKDD